MTQAQQSLSPSTEQIICMLKVISDGFDCNGIVRKVAQEAATRLMTLHEQLGNKPNYSLYSCHPQDLPKEEYTRDGISDGQDEI